MNYQKLSVWLRHLILLAQGHYREFIERKERGEFTYASSEQLIEMSLSEADFALGVVDFDGARKIKSFYQKNHPDVQVLTTYLMPSNMSFVQLTKRIINSRPMGEILGNENPGRGVLAVEEIYRAQSEEVDLIIHNPNEEKGPFTAVDAYCDLANWLKKE